MIYYQETRQENTSRIQTVHVTMLVVLYVIITHSVDIVFILQDKTPEARGSH